MLTVLRVLLIRRLEALRALLRRPSIVGRCVARRVSLEGFNALLINSAIIKSAYNRRSVERSIGRRAISFLQRNSVRTANAYNSIDRLGTLLLNSSDRDRNEDRVVRRGRRVHKVLLRVTLGLYRRRANRLVRVLAFRTRVGVQLTSARIERGEVFGNLVIFTANVSRLTLRLPTHVPNVLCHSRREDRLGRIESHSDGGAGFLARVF